MPDVGPQIWSIITSIGLALLTVIISGLVYWLRKLDDRQFQMAQSVATKDDLAVMEGRVTAHILHIDRRDRTDGE